MPGDLSAFGATNPRDLVYGGLGLVRRSSIVQPDYAKSVLEVFSDATKKAIAEIGSLELLRIARHRLNYLEVDITGPSWMPDFERKYDATLDASSPPAFYIADDLRSAVLVEDKDTDDACLLSLEGTISNRVAERIAVLKDTRGVVSAAEALCNVGTTDDHTLETRREICLTLVPGSGPDSKPWPSAEAFAAYSEHVKYVQKTSSLTFAQFQDWPAAMCAPCGPIAVIKGSSRPRNAV